MRLIGPRLSTPITVTANITTLMRMLRVTLRRTAMLREAYTMPAKQDPATAAAMIQGLLSGEICWPAAWAPKTSNPNDPSNRAMAPIDRGDTRSPRNRLPIAALAANMVPTLAAMTMAMPTLP